MLAWPAASQLTILRDDPRLRLTLRPGMNIAWLAFNTAKPPLDNPEVRHALALAINNQRLMQSISMAPRRRRRPCCRGPRGPTIMTLKLPNIIRRRPAPA